ncbi:hypothetical protein [Streptomyces hydrogenans]|uniref:hypothetical protein n=1 Tax=Streptomyces hydrogenans TaxID=1873719 RepID=UPI0038278268
MTQPTASSAAERIACHGTPAPTVALTLDSLVEAITELGTATTVEAMAHAAAKLGCNCIPGKGAAANVRAQLLTAPHLVQELTRRGRTLYNPLRCWVPTTTEPADEPADEAAA